MLIKDNYVLGLYWSSIEKISDDVCVLNGSYFSGAAIKNAKQINDADSIVIDLTPQYSNIISSFYFVTLEWNGVRYIDNKVYFGEARLKCDNINLISKLHNSDFIVIDTEKHEESVHMYNLVYKGFVLNKEGKEYKDV